MSVLKKSIYVLFSLTVCGLLLTCTSLDFEEEEGEEEGLPIITLLGPAPFYLNIGDDYKEPGALAYDSVDGNLTDDIDIDKAEEDVNTLIPGEQYIKYSVSNSLGKTGTAERKVIVQDSEGTDVKQPVITLNGNDPEYVNVGEDYTDPGATAYDEVDGDLTKEIDIFDVELINTSKPDTFTIWYMVQDKSNNVARATRTVIVVTEIEDTEPPVITLNSPDPYNIQVGYDYTEPGATAHDNVDGDISDDIVIDSDSVNTSEVGTYRVYYTVSDAAGNTADTVRIVNVSEEPDTIPPVITLLGENPVTINIGDDYKDSGATAYDAVDGDLTDQIDMDDDDVNTSELGTYEVIFTVSDASGNGAEKKRTVIIADLEPPEITLLGPNPVNLDNGFPYTEHGATAVDNVDGDLTDEIVTDNSSVNTSVDGIYKVTYTVSDSAENEAKKERTVNVGSIVDTIPPEITLLGDNPMNLDVGDTYNEPGATAWDNFDGDITDSITIGGDVVNTSTEGTYTVTYNVSDQAGNPAVEKRRTVNVGSVADTVPPVITLLGANPMNLNVGDTYNEPGATATDDVDGDITSSIVIGGDVVNTSTAGTYIVTYNVSDQAGNPAVEKSRTVNVNPVGDDLVLEDFESGPNGQTKFAQENFTANDGWWYGFNDNAEGGESTMDPDPATDPSFDAIVQGNVGYNNSRGLHITMTLKRGPSYPYPYCAVGFSIGVEHSYYNFSKMEQIKFRVKGTSTGVDSMQVYFETKRVIEWTPAEDAWGHLGTNFKLNSNWTEFSIVPSQLLPAQYSPQETAGITWNSTDVKDKVTAIIFQTHGNDGDVIELYIDDIQTVGLKASDIISLK